MRQRCHTTSHKSFANYGGRGIIVCDRWRHSFEAFLEDMGPRPSPKHSIDRIDNDGPYSPENCRWATMAEQGANKRSNVMLTAFGETTHLHEWARRAGYSAGAIYGRLRAGWDAERAIATPLAQPGINDRNRMVTAFGETMNMQEWSRRTGIKLTTLRGRLDRGWDAERALTAPRQRMLTAFGETLPVREWCRRTGIKRKALECRLYRGWDAERALSTPSQRARK
jgi:hypothetical protein